MTTSGKGKSTCTTDSAHPMEPGVSQDINIFMNTGDYLLIPCAEAMRLTYPIGWRLQKGVNLFYTEQTVHIVVMSQEISRKRLRLIQSTILGGNGLQLLDKGVSRHVARLVSRSTLTMPGMRIRRAKSS